jgi:hypothetical protein
MEATGDLSFARTAAEAELPIELKHLRILGTKTELLRTLVAAAGVESAAAGVRSFTEMARPKGFEPLTPRFVVWCSIQLSYGRVFTRVAGLNARCIR